MKPSKSLNYAIKDIFSTPFKWNCTAKTNSTMNYLDKPGEKNKPDWVPFHKSKYRTKPSETK